jgi:hypothetical protein
MIIGKGLASEEASYNDQLWHMRISTEANYLANGKPSKARAFHLNAGILRMINGKSPASEPSLGSGQERRATESPLAHGNVDRAG